MHTDYITYYSPITTDVFVKIIKDMDNYHMYLCRLELAYKYAKLRFPSDDMDWNTTGFWNWFMRIWENNDKSIINSMRENEHREISEAVYLGYQEGFLNKYLPTFWSKYDNVLSKKLTHTN